MGRNAKLKQQRRGVVDPKSVRVLYDQAMPTEPELAEPPAAKSWLGNLVDRFKPSPSVQPPVIERDGMDFLRQHAVLLGAIAWEGYNKLGRGILLINDGDSTFEAEYIARSQIKAMLRNLSIVEVMPEITTLIKTYAPQADLIALVVNQTETIDMCFMPNIEIPPAECYRRRQAEPALTAEPDQEDSELESDGTEEPESLPHQDGINNIDDL